MEQRVVPQAEGSKNRDFALIGARGAAGGQLLSYLLFDKGYCNALMDLGYKDGMARKDELVPWLVGA